MRTRAPLAGWTIAISRPVGQAAPLAGRVRALGGASLVLPGSTLRGAPDPDAARRALALRADAVLFTSPVAVRFAFALAPGWRPPRGAAVLAVGPGTRAALARRGVDSACPASRHDSEGVLALPALARRAGGVALLVGAPGGRDLIAPALARRGWRVARAEVYRRAAPRWNRTHHAALAAADPRRLVWLVSSAEAAATVRALAGAGYARLARGRAVASSARIADALRESGLARVALARSARPAEMIDALCKLATQKEAPP